MFNLSASKLQAPQIFLSFDIQKSGKESANADSNKPNNSYKQWHNLFICRDVHVSFCLLRDRLL